MFKKWLRNLRHPHRLVTFVATYIIIIFGGISLASWGLMKQAALPTVGNLLDMHVEGTLGGLKESVDRFFGSVQSMLYTTKWLMHREGGEEKPSDFLPYGIGVMESQPQVDGLTFVWDKGDFLHVQRTLLPEGARTLTQLSLMYSVILREDGVLKKSYFTGDGTPLTEEVLTKLAFFAPENFIREDPRNENWYKEVRQHGKDYWSSAYVMPVPQAPVGVTLAHPFGKERGPFRGAVAAHINMTTLSDLCARQVKGWVLTTLVFTDKGRLIAYPDVDTLFHYTGQGIGLETLDKISGNNLNQAYAHYQKTKKHKIPVLSTRGQEKDLFYVFPLGKRSDEEWLLGVLISGDQTVGLMRRLNISMMGIYLGGFILALCFALMFSRKISRPILGVSKILEEVKRLRLSGLNHHVIPSAFYEIHGMMESVRHVIGALESFEKFVPTQIVRHLLDTNQTAQLGGEKKTLTVLFADLKDSSRLSETMTPLSFFSHISECFDRMTKIVYETHGTLDKYIGDEIMAFWGAPIAQERHAFLACQAALRCIAMLQRSIPNWQEDHKPALTFRFGINTGPMLVGNFGSHDRLQYSVLGDHVNTAARLEYLNKIYGTSILIGHNTYVMVKEDFVLRPVDYVRVRGQEMIPLMVYELLDEYGHYRESATQLALHVDQALRTQEAFDYYQEGEWTKAEELYTFLVEHHGDALARTMAQRCRQYAQQPPVHWDKTFST